MKNIINDILKKYKIDCCGIIPFSECRVTNASKLSRYIENPVSAAIFLAPYYSGEYEGRNVSLYAVPRDYHLFFRELFSVLEKALKEAYPEYCFKSFADNSPIYDVGAAAKAGLGIIGDNHLLINEKYGSYVFIGEIITDMPQEKYDTAEIKFCGHCGECRKACPSPGECLSGLTQKKGELSPKTAALMKKSGIIWGCDDCQIACPLNIGKNETEIGFFRESPVPKISAGIIASMNEEEFMQRAWSWKGKDCILRNLKITE